jgi:hypothetical protein
VDWNRDRAALKLRLLRVDRVLGRDDRRELYNGCNLDILPIYTGYTMYDE